jgi:Fur family transcriptional regulator, peroxide stress response regulator
MNPLDHYTSTLKQAGLRLTPQRIAICKLISETDAHPTMSAIYKRIRVQYPSISLMTVYNTINTLVDLGVVNELGRAGDDNTHYDGNTSPHINLACTSCHKIVDLVSPIIADLGGEISRSSDFKVLGVRMMYYGLCPDCQKSTVQ